MGKTSTSMVLNIQEAEYVGDYRISLAFSDGTTRVIDLAPFLADVPNPVYKKYRLKQNFKKFKIVNGNLNWNDDEMIFPVWDLYRGVVN